MSAYPDSVRYLYSLGNEVKTIKLGLERIRALLGALGHPERSCRHIHVAGTNGKGSVCAMVECGLRAAGARTGMFTSPHLVEPTERIQVGGTPVGKEDFVAAFQEVHQAAERLLAQGGIDGHPTYFETVTAMGFLLFRELGADMVVLEVGLGGRLDATNVVMPRLCILTPIDYDHENYLGTSLETIAAEKAGILKPGVPAVFSRQCPEVMRVLERRARALGSRIYRTEDWQVEQLQLRREGSRFLAAGPEVFPLECSLAGEHQVENALTAAVALHCLGTPLPEIQTGIREARWPGRLERVAATPEIILDGAHNPAGIRALAAYVARFYPGDKVWIIFGSMRDKAIHEISETLGPVAREIILTAPDSARAVRPETLREMFDHPSVHTAPRLREALAIAAKAAPDETVFITGSLFLVGEARGMLVK